MNDANVRTSEPLDTALPDGTRVRVVPTVIPILDEEFSTPYREVWSVYLHTDAPEPTSRWVPPLAADFTPALALEAAWIDMLVERSRGFPGGVSLPAVPRFVVLRIERVSGRECFTRAAESQCFATRLEARDGFELRCAEFVSSRKYGSEIYLIDRKARRCLATSSEYGLTHRERDPIVEHWIRTRRGPWTGTEVDDVGLPTAATCGVVNACDGSLVAVPAAIQTAIDAVVKWAHGGKRAEAEWKRLTDYVEAEGLGLHDPNERMIQAFPPNLLLTLGDLRSEIDDEDVRDQYDVGAGVRVTNALRLRYYVEVTLASRRDEGDESWSWQFPLDITARDGRRAVVPRAMVGAMMSTECTTRWYAPSRSWIDYPYELEAAGWLVDIDRWLELEPEAQREHFLRARGRRR